MRLAKHWVPVIGVGAIALSVAVAMATGVWVSSGREEIARKTEAGTIAAEDIKGWMTIADVVRLFRVDERELRERVGIPAAIPAATALRDLEDKVADFETDKVRQAVASLLAGQPDRPAKEGEQTSAPVGKAKAEGPAAPETSAASTQVVPVTGAAVKPAPAPTARPAGAAGPSGEEGHQSSPEPGTDPAEIKGYMTLAEVSEAFGIPLAELRANLGLPEDADPHRALRDFRGEVPAFEVEQAREVVRQWLAGRE